MDFTFILMKISWKIHVFFTEIMEKTKEEVPFLKSNRLQMSDQLNLWNPKFSDASFAVLDRSWNQSYCSPYSRLYYPIQGEAFLEWEGGRMKMQAGFLYFIPAGLTFKGHCEARAEKFYFHINLLKSDGYDLAASLGEILSMPLPVERIALLESLRQERSVAAVMRLKAAVLEDLAALFEQKGIQAEGKEYSPAVKKSLSLIREHLSLQISVKELAEAVYLSEAGLSRLFLKELGKTPGQYIDEMLCFEAQRQLALTDRSIRTIAERLGFCDQFYFSRRFRQWMGKTPSQYRKEEQYNREL